MAWNSTRFFLPAVILLIILPPHALNINWFVTFPLVLVLVPLLIFCPSLRVKQNILIIFFLVTILFLHDFRLNGIAKALKMNIPEKEYVELLGKVSSQIHPTPDQGFSFLLSSRSVHFHNKTNKISLVFQIHLSKGPLPDGLARGAHISVSAELSPLKERNNFGMISKKKQQLSKGIDWFASCKSPQLIEVITPAPWPWKLLHWWREKMNASIEEIPLSQEIGSLAKPLFKAVFLGYPFQGDPRLYTEFTISGALHLLAISGTHIALITAFSFFVFSWLPPGIRRSMCAFVIMLYLLQAAAPISAQRAAIISWAWLWASHRKRTLHLAHILGLAGSLDLIMNPFIIFSPAFILTYSICFALAFWADWLGFGAKKQTAKSLTRRGITLLKTQWLALMASAPLTLYLFNQTSLVSLPAGLLLIPLFSLILPLAAISLLLYMFIPTSIAISTIILTPTLKLFQILLRFFSHGEPFLLYRQAPGVWILLVYMGLLYYSGAHRPSKPFKGIPFLLSLAILIHFLLPDSPRHPASTEIHIPDIGQGEIHALLFPSGRSMLVDCGGSLFSDQRSISQTVTSFLLNNRIHPEWIAISHFHSDHCGTLPALIRIFKPKHILCSEHPQENPFFTDAQAFSAHGTKWILVRKGYQMTVDNTHLSWLYPETISEPPVTTHNGHSQVIRLDSGHFSMLFCGDIGIPEEKVLTEHCGNALDVDVLKVPHHGSKSSSSSLFLQATSPLLSVFHCARHNPFLFPHPTVLSRYHQFAIPTWFTWQGGIILSANEDGLWIKCASDGFVPKIKMRTP